MKKYFVKLRISLLLIGFISTVSISNAQSSSLTLDATQLYSSFKFLDTDGFKLNSEYEAIYTGGYALGYRYVTDFGLIVRPGVGMRNAGASMVYDDINYSWKLQYLDTKLGLGYIYDLGRVSPYFVASGYYAYMLRGFQTLNNEDFNITEMGLLNRNDYGVIFTPGVEIKLSEYISTYVEFNYIWGLQNLETDAGQTASNFAMGLSLGLSFNITEL